MERVYLDHAATTPLRPEALDAMLPFLRGAHANPSSLHASGQRVRHALDEAREKTAALLGAKPSEIVFTGSGSEADCLAIAGIMDAYRGKGNHFITSAIEHHAVLHTADELGRRSVRVTVLPVDREGTVRADDLRAALCDDTVLVSVMHANNEIGTLQSIRELADIAHERGALFHTDAVQTVGHVALDVRSLGVDALSLSAHKFEGPKGCGALFIRKGVNAHPIVFGGSQEGGRRAGTENVPGIVGLAAALERAVSEIDATAPAIRRARDRLIDGVLSRISGAALCGPRNRRMPNNANIRFASIEGQTVVIALDQEGFEVSTGSACTSGSLEPSHVLTAIGLDGRAARSAVRFSLGRTTTDTDVDRLLEILPGTIDRLRSLAGVLLA